MQSGLRRLAGAFTPLGSSSAFFQQMGPRSRRLRNKSTTPKRAESLKSLQAPDPDQSPSCPQFCAEDVTVWGNNHQKGELGDS
jgi:hypothetical protein